MPPICLTKPFLIPILMFIISGISIPALMYSALGHKLIYTIPFLFDLGRAGYDTGEQKPSKISAIERCIFIIFVNVFSILLLGIIYVKYRKIRYVCENTAFRERICALWVNRLHLVIGTLAASILSLVGILSCIDQALIKLGLLFCILIFSYQLLDVCLSIKVYPAFGTIILIPCKIIVLIIGVSAGSMYFINMGERKYPLFLGCGVPNRNTRILGGETTQIHEFPWSSLIQLKENSEKPVPGTIINNKYVLTAASPIFGMTPFDLKVTIGQHDRCLPDRSSSNISVDRIIVHPDFSNRTKAHDFALIRLTTPITFKREVSPICLSTPSTKYLGQVATILGWFEDKSSKEKSCTSRKLGLPVLDLKSCLLNINNTETYFTQDKGCVGVIGSKSPVCSDDVGSPVMFRSFGGIYELIGILPEYNDCSQESNVAYYTTVNDHLSWITKNTRDSCYCFKT